MIKIISILTALFFIFIINPQNTTAAEPKYLTPTKEKICQEKNDYSKLQEAIGKSVKITVGIEFKEKITYIEITDGYNKTEATKEILTSGTGILIGDGMVLTSAHVVLNKDNTPAKPVKIVIHYTGQYGETYFSEHSIDKEIMIYADDDLAILKILNFEKPADLEYLEFEPKLPSFGEIVAVLGNFDEDHDTLVDVGNIANPSVLSIHENEETPKRRIALSRMTILEGNSGGPIINAEGKIIGIAAGYAAQTNHGLAIPTKTILKFLDEIKSLKK